MKDRKSRFPGRFRLTKVSGQPDTYDITRADEPTQVGTPLSAATFLKPETAKKIGLMLEDPSVDDAIMSLAKKVEPIESFARFEEINKSIDEDTSGEKMKWDSVFGKEKYRQTVQAKYSGGEGLFYRYSAAFGAISPPFLPSINLKSASKDPIIDVYKNIFLTRGYSSVTKEATAEEYGAREAHCYGYTDTGIVHVYLKETYSLYNDYFSGSFTLDFSPTTSGSGIPSGGKEGDILRIVGGSPAWQAVSDASKEAM